jgi:hypothetical protein
MRQGPSEVHVQIKRSFFPKGLTPAPLDNVIMAVKGVYSSIRLCDVSFRLFPNTSMLMSSSLRVLPDKELGLLSMLMLRILHFGQPRTFTKQLEIC